MLTNIEILWALFALGIVGTIYTQWRRRTQVTKEWFAENWEGMLGGFITAFTLFLIGTADDIDSGSYMARTWAAGIGAGIQFVVGGNFIGKQGKQRRILQGKS